MSDDRTLGEWMRRRRAELDLTRERLAEQVGCAVETIRKIETGQRRPSRQVAELLARALELPPDERAAFVRAARRPPSLSTAASERAPKTKPGEAPAVTAAPTPATSFVGRAAELAAVAELLARPDCRLITLLGPGGIGKTRLALRAIEAPLPFAGGAAFVPLAGVASPELLAPTIAAALGCALHGSRAPLAQLLSYLRERSLLLVLDNLEHLRDDAGVSRDALTAILEQAPLVRLLVTSRERLHLPGEWVVDLGGLAPPERDDDESFERSEAVALFLQRARQVRAGFGITAADRPHVARICRLVEGLPLAIELAAAWARALDCQEIADELARGLDFLAHEQRDVAPRHRSIRAAIEHSWRLLDEEERAVARRLSVFRGGCDRAAAAEVSGADPAALAALIDKSLLRQGGHGRYDMHELVRQYAAARLAEHQDERLAARDRHAAYFAGWLGRAEPRLKSAEQRAAADALAAEIDNLRRAWTWAVERRQAALVARMLPSLWYGYEILGWYEEGEALLRQAAAAWRDDADAESRRLRGQLLAHRAWFDLHLGRHDQALDTLRRSRALLDPPDNPPTCAAPLFILGVGALLSGDLAAAREALERGLAHHRALGDRWGMAYCRHYLGLAALVGGGSDEAGRQLREALALLGDSGDPRLAASCLLYLGDAAAARGDLRGAERLYDDSMALSQRVGDRWGIANLLRQRGELALRRGDARLALDLLRQSEARLRELGERWSLAYAQASLGMAALELGDERAAGRAFREVLSGEIAPALVFAALQSLAGMAAVLARSGAPTLAAELATAVLDHPASRPATRAFAEQLLARQAPEQRSSDAARPDPRVARSLEELIAIALAATEYG